MIRWTWILSVGIVLACAPQASAVTRASATATPPPDLQLLRERVASLESKVGGSTDLRDRLATVEAKLGAATDVRDRISTLEGKLASNSEHVKELVDSSIASSDRIRDYMTFIGAVLAAAFAVGTGFYWRQAKKSLDHRYEQAIEKYNGLSKAHQEAVARHHDRAEELEVLIQIARAVSDLLRADNIQEPLRKRVWWSSAYGKLSRAGERAQHDPDWLNWRAFVTKRLGDVPGALDIARRAASSAADGTPQLFRAQYNIACYSSLLGDGPEAIRALRDAVLGDALFKAVAAIDTDFDRILADAQLRQQFAEIIAPEKRT